MANERNAGRKLVYGEETVLVQFKVPKSKKEVIKTKFKDILKEFETSSEIVQDEVVVVKKTECLCVMDGTIFKRAKPCKLTKEQHKF